MIQNVIIVSLLALCASLFVLPSASTVAGTGNVSTAASASFDIESYKLNTLEALKKFTQGNTSSALKSLTEVDQQLLSSISKQNAEVSQNASDDEDGGDLLKFKRREVTSFVNTTDQQLLSAFTQLNNTNITAKSHLPIPGCILGDYQCY